MHKSHLLPACLFLFSYSSFTQTSNTQQHMADSLFQVANWPAALQLYDQLLTNVPAPAFTTLFRKGICHRNMGHHEAAITTFKKCLKNTTSSFTMFYLALEHSAINQSDSALIWLGKAVTNGYGDLKKIEESPEFANLQNDPGYIGIKTQARKQVYPCEFEPKAKEFDFWIGEWNVFNPGGLQVGTSSVYSILGSCVIFENWTDAYNNQGKSFNMYDTSAGIWRQTWVAQSATWTEFRGNWNGEFMRLTTDDFKDRNGNEIRRRMTFTPDTDGTVRQHGERSVDKGQTWSTEYDLTYRRK